MIVAVGDNPGLVGNNVRVAERRLNIAGIYSIVPDATTVNFFDNPWAETHGYIHLTATRPSGIDNYNYGLWSDEYAVTVS